jgi:hypothetical protein
MCLELRLIFRNFCNQNEVLELVFQYRFLTHFNLFSAEKYLCNFMFCQYQFFVFISELSLK